MRNFALDLGNVAAEFLNAEVSVIMVFVAVVVMAVLTLNSRTYAEVSLLLLTFLSTMIINKGCEFQSNGVPVPEERCAHSNANGVAVPFQTA